MLFSVRISPACNWKDHLLPHIRTIAAALLLLAGLAPSADTAPVHTTYLWHMHQPLYWPDRSIWNTYRYEMAYETITLGHSQNNVFDIFNKDDRVADYQYYPRDAISSVLDIPDAGAQVSFAGTLIENIKSLGDAGWNGGRYASDWYSGYRTARSWTTSGGRPRLEQVLVAAHHPIAPLMDETALKRDIEVAKAAYDIAWGGVYSKGYFPAEMCFSERMIPALAEAGVEWVVVADIHISRACADYPYSANLDNCDPPNPADQVNPAQGYYQSISISRGVTVKTPAPYGYRPHYARYVDPETGEADSVIVVPAANAMSWNEGYGLYGTGEIDAIAGYNDPAHPMLILFVHDGDNAWSGGYTYYNENVSDFSHQAVTQGYEPSTVDEYLADHPVDPSDMVHVEDGGWVNADGDFGSPQFINWNWPLVDQSGNFDIPGGWAEDERNWAVLTAAQNRVETAEEMSGSTPDPAHIFDPAPGSSSVEKAWHHLLSGYESGYMYYGASLDMEVKATLACNAAVDYADPVISGGGTDNTAPTIWLPQRLPWNPGGRGGGSLWGYPGGDGAEMPSDFWVWTFAYDVSGLERVELMYRIDEDGANPMSSDQNETYASGSEVGSWTAAPMTHRTFPNDDFFDSPEIDFTVLPDYIADEYYLQVTGLSDVLVDYFIEAEDSSGNVKRTPIQHVWVGEATGSASHVIDGELDEEATLVASGGDLDLYADWDGRHLYLATNGIGSTAEMDHFIIVGTNLSSPVAAPWAKAGTVASRSLFIGNEDGNNWCGWFDSGENLLSSGTEAASGAWLEGLIDLEEHLGFPLPDGVYLCAAAWNTPDGGVLLAQSPAGGGNGNIEESEYVWYPFSTTASEVANGTGISLYPARPNPFSGSTTIDLFLPRPQHVKLAVYDVRGRKVSTIVSGMFDQGRHSLSWDGSTTSGRPATQGIYFLKMETGGKVLTRKIVVLK